MRFARSTAARAALEPSTKYPIALTFPQISSIRVGWLSTRASLSRLMTVSTAIVEGGPYVSVARDGRRLGRVGTFGRRTGRRPFSHSRRGAPNPLGHCARGHAALRHPVADPPTCGAAAQRAVAAARERLEWGRGHRRARPICRIALPGRGALRPLRLVAGGWSGQRAQTAPGSASDGRPSPPLLGRWRTATGRSALFRNRATDGGREGVGWGCGEVDRGRSAVEPRRGGRLARGLARFARHAQRAAHRHPAAQRHGQQRAIHCDATAHTNACRGPAEQ